MTQTSLSMLEGMREDDPQQWTRFNQLFAPLIYEWCRRSQIRQHDSADIVQEVFRVVAERLADYQASDASSPFHRWLWGITHHKIQDYFRSLYKQPVARGGSTAHAHLAQHAAANPQEWSEDRVDEDRQVIYFRALELIKVDFKEHTWKAFWRTAVDGVSAPNLTDELGMSVGAIYNARYKVTKRLQEEFGGLL